MSIEDNEIMKNETLFKLGQKIRYERVKRNMSQEKLAEIANMNFRSISYIECGKHDIKFLTLEKIAKALEIEISELIQFKM